MGRYRPQRAAGNAPLLAGAAPVGHVQEMQPGEEGEDPGQGRYGRCPGGRGGRVNKQAQGLGDDFC